MPAWRVWRARHPRHSSTNTTATTTTMPGAMRTLSTRHLLRVAQHTVEHGRHPAVQGRDDTARQLAPEVGRVDAHAVQVLDAEHGARRRVVERDVGGAADLERRRVAVEAADLG